MKKHNLQPRGFQKKYLSLVAILALHSILLAQSQNATLENQSSSSQRPLNLSILHNHTLTDNQDFKETFDEATIRKSNTQNIYDFLKSHSLLNIKTNYGNPYTQSVDLRGLASMGIKILPLLLMK